MSATAYSVDLRDIRFVLYEQLDFIGTLDPLPAHDDVDRALCDQMLDEANRICADIMAPLNKPADRQGCAVDAAGNVTTPDGFAEAWRVAGEGGWLGLAGREDLGGMGMPHTIDVAIQELFTAANTSFATYPGLTRASANMLAEFAPDDLRELVCDRLYTGRWAGTMCLTEADAGSSVGDNRARAMRTDRPGVYRITGEKVFITGGDNDFSENILHLVLARTPDAPEGTRGLSLFLVPKFAYDGDGVLGARNDVFVTSIEEKMGLHGSATCVLALGADGEGAEGRIVGEEGEGMKIMFRMMNEARLGVGLQGLAGAAVAYQNAVSYARERIQGSSVENFRDPSAPRVPIIQHPDVRRMLLWQKVHIEAMRSFIYSLALRFDLTKHTEDQALRDRLMGQLELMTPICKAHCSDRGFECTVLAVQTFGGAGYTGEFPVEQHMRDTKIASIYEGTNGIQALDLLGRKMRMAGGAHFMAWMGEATELIESAKAHDALADAASSLEKAVQTAGMTAMHLSGVGAGGDIAGAMVHATPFLEMMGTIVLGLHSLWQGRVALEKLDKVEVSDADARFYRGKVVGVRFYVAQVLPRAIALSKTIRSGDKSCLEEVLWR